MRSSSGLDLSSLASMSSSRLKRSRWLATLTYSPAAIEKAPASSPAMPANSTTPRSTPEPANPMTRAVLETRPSLMPKIAARTAPDVSTRCQVSPKFARPSALMTPRSTTPVAGAWSRRRRKVLACSRSSADIDAGASGSSSYMPALAPSSSSRRASTSFMPMARARATIAASSESRDVGAGGTGTPYSFSLLIQCAVCSSSMVASSRKASRRSPSLTSASAR